MRLDNVKERLERFRPSSYCIRHVTLAVKSCCRLLEVRSIPLEFMLLVFNITIALIRIY
jgi:hypothetical protein